MRPGRIASGTRAGEASRAHDWAVGLAFAAITVTAVIGATQCAGAGGSDVGPAPVVVTTGQGGQP